MPRTRRPLARVVLLLYLLEPTSVQADDLSGLPNQMLWNETGWRLLKSGFELAQYQTEIPLANGYIGTSVSPMGLMPAFYVNKTEPNGTQPINGWPLFDPKRSFSTISGFYDLQPNATGTNHEWLNQYGSESFIAGIPFVTEPLYTISDVQLNSRVNSSTISEHTSSMSFKTGVANISYTWIPEDNLSLNVTREVLVSRYRPNVIAVKSRIVSSCDVNGTVTALLDGRTAERSYLNAKGMDSDSNSIWTSVHPFGRPNVTAYIVSGIGLSNSFTDISSRAPAADSHMLENDISIGQTFNIHLKAGEVATFYIYAGLASSQKNSDPESTARQAQKAAQKDGWDILLAEHMEAWSKIMTPDSVASLAHPVTGELPGDPILQAIHIMNVASTFYLLQQLQPPGSGLNDDSVAVSGLTSSSYAGLIFWDADYWMAPPLNLAFPEWAEQIPNFRVKQYAAALTNAKFGGYPDGSALYPWTAGEFGNFTGTGPAQFYEYHLNTAIALNNLQLYKVTNNATWFNDGPKQVLYSTASALANTLTYNATTKTYWLKNMTDPDEYANSVDNGAYTMISISKLLGEANKLRVADGLPINETWEAMQTNVQIARAPSGITLEYQTMNNSVVVKQADVVLSILSDNSQNYTLEKKLQDLDYYAIKQSPDGPAMTYSAFAIVANALSTSGTAAYTYMAMSFLPYLREPFFQFSEQAVDDPSENGGTNPAFPFLTGAGAFLQQFLFALLGLRSDQDVLYINPSLPPQIPYLKLCNFYFAGGTFSARMNTTHTVITRLQTSKSGLIDEYPNTTFPFRVGLPGYDSTLYEISVNQTVFVPNRLYWQNLTYKNNLIQSLPVTSNDPYFPGQFPLAAVDGSNATRWQPAANGTSSLTVNMTSIAPSLVEAIYLDFGNLPPENVTVYFGNSTLGINETSCQLPPITPNLPYNSEEAEANIQEVKPVVANSTLYTLNTELYSGRYVRLEVAGSWAKDGKGPTVAEFVLVGAAK